MLRRTLRQLGSRRGQLPDVRMFSSSSLDPQNRLIVVGSGVAGSAAALVAAETYQRPVTMIFAGSQPTDCNSYWAQGGIIYRNKNPKSGDSAASLAADIHRAGAGTRRVAVRGVHAQVRTGQPVFLQRGCV